MDEEPLEPYYATVSVRGQDIKFEKLHVDPEASSQFFKPRSVPYAMKGKVEEELDHLQRQGIIEPA